MKKILNIGGNDVAFTSNAVTPIYYKAEFKRDFYSDLIKLAKAMQNTKTITDLGWEELDHMDLDVITQFAWACAKSADKNTKPYMDWLDENPEFNLFEHGIKIAELITSSLEPKKK